MAKLQIKHVSRETLNRPEYNNEDRLSEDDKYALAAGERFVHRSAKRVRRMRRLKLRGWA